MPSTDEERRATGTNANTIPAHTVHHIVALHAGSHIPPVAVVVDNATADYTYSANAVGLDHIHPHLHWENTKKN